MVRSAVCLLALLVISAIPAYAQEQNKVDVSVGYSLFRANPATPGFGSFTLNGASGSASYNFNNWLGGVFDFGGYHNGNILNSGVGADVTLSQASGPSQNRIVRRNSAMGVLCEASGSRNGDSS
jgi:Outer membrane protein beta-barrel domain